MEEMLAEEQQAVEECTKEERQRVRWADVEESLRKRNENGKSRKESGRWGLETGSGKLMSHDTAEEERLEVGKSGENQVEQQEAVVETRQKEEK